MLSANSVNSSSHRIKLPDGRLLAFAEYGDPNGSPIFLFHGTPGSRLFRHPDESIITSMNVRLITPERPGFGLSDFQQDRKILDWPDDLLVLADALGLASFGVIGYSGGGPHAAACALRIPNRLSGAVMVSSTSPLNSSDTTAGMVWLNRVLFGLARDSYALAKLSWWIMHVAYSHNPSAFMDFQADLSPESERVTFRKPEVRAMLTEDFAEAHRTGINGVAWEIVLLAREWGFRPEDITMEVNLWQGEEDVRTPVSMGRALAAAIPNARAKFVPGEGHDVLYLHWKEILLCLLHRQSAGEVLSSASGKKKRPSRSRRSNETVEAKRSRTHKKTPSARVTTDRTPQESDEGTDLVSTASNSTRDE